MVVRAVASCLSTPTRNPPLGFQPQAALSASPGVHPHIGLPTANRGTGIQGRIHTDPRISSRSPFVVSGILGLLPFKEHFGALEASGSLVFASLGKDEG